MKWKSKSKKIVIFLLILCVVVISVPPVPHVPLKVKAAENGVLEKLNELKNRYPSGMYWHRVNGQNVVTSIPCKHPSGTVYSCNYDETNGCGHNYLGRQCVGFAGQIYYEIFGEQVPNYKGNRTDVENIMVGDYVRINGIDGHSFIVIARNGNELTGAECNWSAPCRIDWGTARKHYISEVTGFCHATNYDAVGNNPIGDLNNVEGGTNTVWVRGWAFDQDDVSRSIEVHVYIGGPSDTGEGHAIIANTRREDVNNAYGSGIYHGYDATIRTSRVGTQTVYVYAINVGGGTNTLIGTKTVTIAQDTTSPTISDVHIKDVNSEGYTVTCCVKDTEGIAKVQFPTWTVANGQDDLDENWQDSPSSSGTQDGETWSFRVHDKDHDFERGIYRTHIYAWDNNGNCTCYELNNIEFQNTYSPANTVSYNGHTYGLYNDIMTWDEAKAKCEELGGHLVTITSAEEQETVAGLIRGQARTGYWIGGSSKYGSTWVTGEEFSFSNWAPGEPNLDGGEDSYGIYTGTGTWNDWAASNKSVVTNKSIGLGFICEWDAKLEAVKESGKTELENYKNASDYRPAQQEELRKAIAEGVAAIDAASDEAGVSRALAEAKAVMDAIKTDAQLTAEETAAHTHSYADAWKTNSEKHWKECECGDKSGEAEHIFSWVIDRAPTVENTGMKHEECETCGYMRNEGTTIEKLPPTHVHSYGTEWKADNKSHWKACSCGAETDRGNHDFGDWVTDKEATATETGTKHRICQTCSYREEGSIPATGESHIHEYGDWRHNDTQHWKECECGDRSEAGAHDFVRQPDGDVSGSDPGHEICSVCGYTESEPEEHTHVYEDFWKSDTDNHWKACSCGAETDRGRHDFGDWVTDKEATATETGTKHRVCQTCNYKEEGTIPATGGGGGNSSGNSGDNARPVGDGNGSSNNGGNGSGSRPDNTAGDSMKSIHEEADYSNTAVPPVALVPIIEEKEETDKKQVMDDKKPFIKDTDNKSGWDIIGMEEKTAEEGDIINVDMNETHVVPGNIFDIIKGRDITLTFDMGNNILWSVNGKEITTEKADDIDFEVITGANIIPADIVSGITGENYRTQLNLAYDGEFGLTAILCINIGKENADFTAELYYYNQDSGEFEFVCEDTVAKDGTVSFAFTHASKYVIVVDREKNVAKAEIIEPTDIEVQYEAVEDDTTVPEEASTEQEEENVLPIVAGMIILIVAGVTVLVWRKKKEV